MKTTIGVLSGLRGTNFGPERCGRAGIYHHEVHAERVDLLLVMLQPVDGAAEEPALVAGLGRREQLGAVVERLPVRQSGTGLLGPGGIPPVLARDGLMVAGIVQTALFERLAEGGAERALPDFQLQGDIAQAATDS